jgi:hypothetical protein
MVLVLVLVRRTGPDFRDRQALKLRFSRYDITELNVEPCTLTCKALFLGIFPLDANTKPRCSEL